MTATDTLQLDTMQANYKTAVDAWINSIRHEETLASGNHDALEVDAWEAAGFEEEDLRNQAKKAKKAYEDSLRQKLYHFHGN